MALRPYAAAKRTLTVADKLMEINWGLVLLIVLIAIAGIAMLYSVAGGHFQPWALRQIGHFTLGLIVMLLAATIDIRMWMSLAYPAYGVALLLLIAVDVVGHVGLGAQRWISLGPLDLQPSELMKISLVLALSRYLHGKSVEEVSKPVPLAIGLAMIAVPAIFVFLQPNLGTTLIIVADGCSLLFLAGLSWWWIAPTLAAVAAAVPLAWRFWLHDYQKARVETFLNPEADSLGAGWNITQAKIAIGSGGVSGKGFLQGTQSRLNFLPEKQTDFIWTSFCEEFGFVGALALLILFAVVIFYGLQTAISARSQFGRLLAMGVILNF
ncbi:MAG: rod shape-determining protein RodA, partial [Alphaproteobacteria bacterium 64-11]